MGDLSGTTVVVAGAGLAGLAAARDLAAMGAAVTVVDARSRVGGRVWTLRDGFVDSQHAEAGGDMIDEGHMALLDLAAELQLKPVRIFRNGWGYARPDDKGGRVRIVRRNASRGWDRLRAALAPLIERYHLAEKRWESPIVADLARQSVAEWLDAVHADGELRTTAAGMRGFFLADPPELSVLALVDQFAEGDAPAEGRMYRVAGGNDQIAMRLAAQLGDRVRLGSEVVALSQRGGAVRISVKHNRHVHQIQADYAVLALPATQVRRIPITPALPVGQHDAMARLSYGRATKTLLQFAQRFWRMPGRPQAFGSPLPFGAVWDASEHQRGRAGILALLAGGSASDATGELVAHGGMPALAASLEWLGSARAQLVGSRQVVWEADPLVRGGYAVFDAAFDPALRGWLSRPCGRVFFAGEHTSIAYQGYMNGAVESGRRAAAEIAATHRLGR